jgi:hypothetical protein
MGSGININVSGGNASFGAVVHGDRNTVTGRTSMVVSTIDLRSLAADLQRLQSAMAAQARGGEQRQSADDVEKAASAAASGDRADAFTHLKAAGRWAFDIATKVGAEVAATALKELLHIP